MALSIDISIEWLKIMIVAAHSDDVIFVIR